MWVISFIWDFSPKDGEILVFWFGCLERLLKGFVLDVLEIDSQKFLHLWTFAKYAFEMLVMGFLLFKKIYLQFFRKNVKKYLDM